MWPFTSTIPFLFLSKDWITNNLFCAVFEFTEKLCVFGLGINLIIYLTEVLHQDIKTAAKNVNYWIGVSTLTSLIGGFIADTYLGRFSMVLVSSLIYLTVRVVCVNHFQSTNCNLQINAW